MPKLFTATGDVDDLKILAAKIQAALPTYSQTAILRLAAIGLRHFALHQLRVGAARQPGSRGRRPTFDMHHLLRDLAEPMAAASGTTGDAVLRTISGYSEDRGATPELAKVVRIICTHHQLPQHGSLQQQARRALTLGK
jgi:hypothetical protein